MDLYPHDVTLRLAEGEPTDQTLEAICLWPQRWVHNIQNDRKRAQAAHATYHLLEAMGDPDEGFHELILDRIDELGNYIVRARQSVWN